MLGGATGEGPDDGGPGHDLGGAGGEARGHREERARSAHQAGLGLLAGAAGPPLSVLSGLNPPCLVVSDGA